MKTQLFIALSSMGFFLFFNGNAQSHDTIGVQIIRGPYLQMASQHSIIVRWRTITPVVSNLSYGPDSTRLLNSISKNSEPVTDHEIEITELSPDTRYYYSIASEGYKTGQYFETLPEKGKEGEYSFLVLGDCGTGYVQQTAVKNAVIQKEGNHFDGVLLLGDNAYQSGTDLNYQSNFFRYNEIFSNSVIWPAPGNHDYNNHLPFSQDPAYYDIFNCPTMGECGGVPSGSEKYYSFDFGNIHFISIDSYDESTKESSDMVQWLKRDLDSNKQEWTVVYWHHPPYSKGSHNSDNPLMNLKMVHMRKRIVPLLEEKGVDLVLNGHSHSYERSMFMHGHYGRSNSLDSTHVLDASGGQLPNDCPYVKETHEAKGTVYCVMGSSGKVSSVHRTWPHPIMHSYDNENAGALILKVNGNVLTVEFLTENGEVMDHYGILKGTNCE